MRKSGLTTERILEKYSNRHRTVRERLKAYAKNADESSVHEVRTAIRRQQTAYSIVPDPCRTRSMKQFMQQSRHFFRQNSELRDCDVMIRRLHELGISGDSELFRLLKRRRKTLAARNRKLVPPLVRFRVPRRRQCAIDPTSLLMQTLQRHTSVFMRQRAEVLRAPTDTEALHTMRKAVKRIHYLLEIEPALADERLMTEIIQVQRLSGVIHDSDVMIGFLSQYRNQLPECAGALRKLRGSRRLDYQALSQLLTQGRWAGPYLSLGNDRTDASMGGGA